MRRRLLSGTFALALVTIGCEGWSAPDTGPALKAGAIAASRVAGGVELYNGTETVIAYQMSNHGWLGLLAACSDTGITCATLAPGVRRVVPVSEITGADAGSFAEARVVYWGTDHGRVLPGANELIVTM